MPELNMQYVNPARRGNVVLKVLNMRGKAIPETKKGTRVEKNSFYNRAIRDGDLLVVGAEKPIVVAQKKDNKKK